MAKTAKLKKPIFEIVGYVALTFILCFFLQALFVPKYMSHPVEGAMIAEYYKSEAEHDIIFIGDCEFYESVSPITLWENFGIPAYVRGSAQMLIWQSYYVLKDTLEVETPKVVVFNVTELKYGTVQSEAYTRLCLDGLKNIKYRLTAAKLSLKEENESLASYVVPLLRYHSRWSDLNSDDFQYMFKRDLVTHEGFLMHTEIKPQTSEGPAARPLTNPNFPDICWEYLDKMADLCEENGIKLVLFKSTVNSWQYPWYDAWEKQVVEYAEKRGITYISGVASYDEIGLDMTTDTYDEGLHLNVYGAEKVTNYLGNILKNEYDYQDRRSDAKQSAIWDAICKRYHEAKGDQ